MPTLTIDPARLEKLLSFIAEYQARYHRPPTRREMQHVVGVSNCSIAKYLRALLASGRLINKGPKRRPGYQVVEDSPMES